jgi:non-homologous end joining protein Ku
LIASSNFVVPAHQAPFAARAQSSGRKLRVGMLDLAKHIVNQKASTFEPDKFEDHDEEESISSTPNETANL